MIPGVRLDRSHCPGSRAWTRNRRTDLSTSEWKYLSPCRPEVQDVAVRNVHQHRGGGDQAPVDVPCKVCIFAPNKFRSCCCEQRCNWQHRCIAEISTNWLSNRGSSECAPSSWDGIKPARARGLRGTVEHHARYRELIRTINPSRRD